MPSLRRALALSLAVTLPACGSSCRDADNRANARGAADDVTKMAAAQGARVTNVECRYGFAPTRAAACTGKASAADVAKLVSGLKLHAAASPATPDPGGCDALPEFAGAAHHETRGKSDWFDYVHVFAVPASERVCIQFRYGWG